MEELLELRQYIQQKQYDQALDLIGEMEEMSRADKIGKIRSFIKILLLHLIKQVAEKRTTRSWDLSIINASSEIKYVNQRPKSSGVYVDEADLRQLMVMMYPIALKHAAIETFEGRYEDDELAQMIDQNLIIEQALALITESQG